MFSGTQVPDQLPLPIDSKPMGGSPSLKLTMTVPLLISFPQSSTTCTRIEVGHAAGATKPFVRLVNSGSNFAGVQPDVDVAGRACDVAAAAESTSRRLTV